MRIPTLNLIAAGVLGALATVGNAGASEPAVWTSLFDGQTLDGWVQRNGKAKYTVENGTIVGTTVVGTPNSFLCTDRDYGDFILELEFWVDPQLNSGIQIRSESRPDYKDGRVHGYQIEIDPSDRAWSGGIYDEARRGWLFSLKDKPEAQRAFKNGEWNHYRIEARGDRLRTWVNGVPAADLRDGMTPRGFIALQVHSAKTSGLQVKWRNIRIKDLDGAAKEAKLKALIIDGQNNHAWQETTPVIRQALLDSGRFTVEVATSPAKGRPMTSFNPEFAAYDVVVSNYTGDEWSAATQTALVNYMNEGGGLVIVHAADNAFPKWEEWNRMIGLGGWGGRNEKHGPYVYWRDGQVVLDRSPGRGGMHGKQVPYAVTTREADHPIMRGLPDEWMHAQDELYSRLRGPAENLALLATARQGTDSGGTGRDEPALFTVRYGKGRVFHTVLGHDARTMQCVGFIVTLQRGTEWVATGTVTLTDLPDDFPTAKQASSRQMNLQGKEAS